MRKLVCAVAAVFLFQSAAAAQNANVVKAFKTLDSSLASEAQKLLAAKKQGEAAEVLAIQKTVQEQFQPMAQPGKCSEMRARMFFEQLPFEWSIPFNPDRFVFERVQTPQGPGIKTKVINPAGNQINEGVLKITGEDSAEVKWEGGVTWKMYAAGNRRLLIDEYNGSIRKHDGFMLSR